MPAIGIDLGTTYCCVGVWQQGKVNIVSNDQGNRTTPSYVAFTDSERVIGIAAKNQVAKNPNNTLFNIKKLIGRPFNDPKIQYEMKNWPFNVVNDCNMPKLQIDCKGEKKRFAPEEISAMILAKMKATAESYLGESVKDAVISVPAHFNNSQRQATKNAGIIAGLNVLRIINEPTAAALAYGLDKNLKGDRNVLIFDLGGGTLDVSILTISEGSQFKVMATAGNTHLGGEDFSNHIVKHLANEFKRKFHHNIQSNTRALQRLYDAAEHAKQTLSQCTEASIELDALYEGINFYTKLTRAKFEELCADLFRATLRTVGKALNGAKLDKSSINDIVLVGGSTRIPKIQNLLQVFFSKKYLSVSINPDEAVAYGAAVQAAVLSGDQTLPIRDVLLVDVAAFSLCIETVGGVMTKIIKRNARIPCKQPLPFTTYTDNQSVVTIQIFEGNRAKNKSNNLLGTLDLINILPSPQGVPKMDVTFDLDANGILTICAKDRTFGQLMNINVRSDNGQLSSEEINRLAIEVNKYREEDENQIARVAARNHLEEYIFKIKQVVEMHGDNFNESNKSMLLTKCEEALRWLDDNMLVGKEDMEHCQQTLQNACSPFIPIFIAVQEATL